MLSTAVRSEPGIITALAAALGATLAMLGLAAALNCPDRSPAGSTAAMPAPSPEAVSVRQTQVASVACAEPGITTIVFKGRVHALDPDLFATFHFRFADLPDRYTVMTGSRGDFEVRVPRAELGAVDLCSLPTSGLRGAAFKDAQLSVEYTLLFER